MPIHPLHPDTPGELHQPFDCDRQAVNALVTVGAFVALADGRVEAIERNAAVDYVTERRVAPSISRQRLAECFDERGRRLQDRDCAQLIVEALRPLAGLLLTSDLVEIAERVAAADRRVHPGETNVISLIRLIVTATPEPKVVESCPTASTG
jgi:tellurite resistance protein